MPLERLFVQIVLEYPYRHRSVVKSKEEQLFVKIKDFYPDEELKHLNARRGIEKATISEEK